jgi:DNA-binding GntR family transcriptional regulator
MRLHIETVPTRSDFVDTVYRVLLDAITDGTLAPGERLTQEAIAEQLHVSRAPVLQALRLLKKDGLIEDAPGRGVRVAALDAQKVGHLYQVRGALDALAVRLACEARQRIDPSLIERGRIAARGDDLKAIIDADVAFHNAIYAASGNPLIKTSASGHWMHLRRIMGAVHQASVQRESIWDEHQAIATAIEQGDTEHAWFLTALHVERASDNVVRRLGAALPAGQPADSDAKQKLRASGQVAA